MSSPANIPFLPVSTLPRSYPVESATAGTALAFFMRPAQHAQGRGKVQPLNYTPVPNEILDNMASMTNAELRVVLMTCRKTIGINRSSTMVSNNEMAFSSGLSLNGLRSGIRNAQKHRYISVFREKQGRGFSTQYTIILDGPEMESSR
jgi:hypothetical protein